MAVWNEIDGLLTAEGAVCVRHAQAEVLDVSIVVFDVHQVVVMLLVYFLQVVNLVALAYEAVQEGLGESTFQKAAVKNGFSNYHAKEFEQRLVAVEALAHVVRHELAVAFVLFEVGIFRIKNFIAELSDELFEETTSVDTFFYLTVLVHKFNLPLRSWV